MGIACDNETYFFSVYVWKFHVHMLMAKSTKARCVCDEAVEQSGRFAEMHEIFFANFLIPWSTWCSSRQYSRQIARCLIVEPSAFKKSRKVQKHRHFSRQKSTRQLSFGVFSYFSGQVTRFLLRHYHGRDRLPESAECDSNTIERSTMRHSSRNRIMWLEKFERSRLWWIWMEEYLLHNG